MNKFKKVGYVYIALLSITMVFCLIPQSKADSGLGDGLIVTIDSATIDGNNKVLGTDGTYKVGGSTLISTKVLSVGLVGDPEVICRDNYATYQNYTFLATYRFQVEVQNYPNVHTVATLNHIRPVIGQTKTEKWTPDGGCIWTPNCGACYPEYTCVPTGWSSWEYVSYKADVPTYDVDLSKMPTLSNIAASIQFVIPPNVSIFDPYSNKSLLFGYTGQNKLVQVKPEAGVTVGAGISGNIGENSMTVTPPSGYANFGLFANSFRYYMGYFTDDYDVAWIDSRDAGMSKIESLATSVSLSEKNSIPIATIPISTRAGLNKVVEYYSVKGAKYTDVDGEFTTNYNPTLISNIISRVRDVAVFESRVIQNFTAQIKLNALLQIQKTPENKSINLPTKFDLGNGTGNVDDPLDANVGLSPSGVAGNALDLSEESNVDYTLLWVVLFISAVFVIALAVYYSPHKK